MRMALVCAPVAVAYRLPQSPTVLKDPFRRLREDAYRCAMGASRWPMPSAVRTDEDLSRDVWKTLDAERRGPTWNPDLSESKHSI